MNPFYTDYATYLQRLFPGRKVQKLSINVGNSCPNRDGTISFGGCIYCNNDSFTPGYCNPRLTVSQQIEEGRRFFRRKYREMDFLAYFQSYSNTHGEMLGLWQEAVAPDDVAGLIVGTRPDCISDAQLQQLAEINRSKPVIIELGAETSHDRTLSIINRGHTFAQLCEAVKRCADCGLHVGLHLIMGLPRETEEDMLQTVLRINELEVESVKFHQLQVIRDTPLARMWQKDPAFVELFTPENYLNLCVKIVGILSPKIAVERFTASAPEMLLLAPRWGLKNYQFTNLLINKLTKTNTR